jgi:hypothetical protein
LKNIVYLYEGAEQECSGYIFVLGVIPARPHPSTPPALHNLTAVVCVV